jgi:hypothetical protein
MVAMHHIADLQFDKVAATQLAIDGEVEHGQVADAVFEIESNPDCPDLLKLEWRFRLYQLTFVPGYLMCWRCRLVSEQEHHRFLR